MHNKSVAELSRELESGNVSSVELAQQFLDRVKRRRKVQQLYYRFRGAGAGRGESRR